MSGGTACRCPKEKKNLQVIARGCNYSAFNGYRYQSSDYSAVQCRTCGRIWRTKAKYVDLLPGGQITIQDPEPEKKEKS